MLWIALLALLVLVEKVTPLGRWIARVAGVVCVVAGGWLLVAGGSNLAYVYVPDPPYHTLAFSE